ncbi:MAG: sensor histidine kinase [Desulfuromonadales bacterium]
METYFAAPERQDKDELLHTLRTISEHELIGELMNASGGLFAVLNEQRQILAINETFLEFMGVANAGDVLGLRLGEYVKCVHACEMTGGCGTSSFCSTCGAAIATVTSLGSAEPVEKTCCIATEKDFREIDLFFKVRCSPIHIDGRKFILLYLQDISMHQQWVYLEQTFLHDASNLLQGLMGTTCSLQKKSDITNDNLSALHNLAERLAQEVSIQKNLSATVSLSYQPHYRELSVISIFTELKDVFSHHRLTERRSFSIFLPEADIVFVSDRALVSRILVNMVSNALEATPENGTVKLYVEMESPVVVFCVWNQGVIPEDAAKRIFQRNYTTKDGLGHGLGTYSMKLFGEKVLGGRVLFESKPDCGTVFKFLLQSK